MSEREEKIALLREAEAAYHDLALGLQPKVIVHQNGQRVEYTQTSQLRLRSYINELKHDLGMTAPRPLKVFF